MKRIILSADDFGRSHERNLAIDYALKSGLIKSAAVIMGSEFTDEAIDMARSGNYLKNVHCHLNLISGIYDGNHFLPLSEEFKKSRFCLDGEFTIKVKKTDYVDYSKVVFKELECQYLEFKKATGSKANYNHIDFHVYGNLRLPVAVAYRRIIEKYHIISARYYGEHHKLVRPIKQKVRLQLANLLSGNKAYVVKSCNADYYLTQITAFASDEIIEIYVHPDYVNGILLDNTVSAFGHKKVSLVEHIKRLREADEIKMISWADLQ